MGTFWESGEHEAQILYEPPSTMSVVSIFAKARSFGTAFPDASFTLVKAVYHGNGVNPFLDPLPPAGGV
jgi:hypothetical protein